MFCIFFCIQTGNLYVFLFQVPVPEGAIGGDAGEFSFFKKEKKCGKSKNYFNSLAALTALPYAGGFAKRWRGPPGRRWGKDIMNTIHCFFFASKDYLEKARTDFVQRPAAGMRY